jgi:non-lysosomal glucosylceramidase
MDYFLYQDRKTQQISFPLGGIGTGCIGLAGNGRLIDWEIFNHPSKGSVNGFSHFAIKAEKDGKVVDARVLHGDLHAPYNGDLQAGMYQSFGFGPRREYLTGMPHFESVDF